MGANLNRMMMWRSGKTTLDGLIILNWWTCIVLSAPDEIPTCSDEEEGHEDDGCVVHILRGDGDVGWHAEEGNGEETPCY
jgi:hypothetical protein